MIMIMLIIFTASLFSSFFIRRYKSRPISNSYCKAGVIPFCPTGQIANSMPKFKPDDKVQLYALKKPVWQFKFGDTLGKFVSKMSHLDNDPVQAKSKNSVSHDQTDPILTSNS